MNSNLQVFSVVLLIAEVNLKTLHDRGEPWEIILGTEDARGSTRHLLASTIEFFEFFAYFFFFFFLIFSYAANLVLYRMYQQ